MQKVSCVVVAEHGVHLQPLMKFHKFVLDICTLIFYIINYSLQQVKYKLQNNCVKCHIYLINTILDTRYSYTVPLSPVALKYGQQCCCESLQRPHAAQNLSNWYPSLELEVTLL